MEVQRNQRARGCLHAENATAAGHCPWLEPKVERGEPQTICPKLDGVWKTERREMYHRVPIAVSGLLVDNETIAEIFKFLAVLPWTMA